MTSINPSTIDFLKYIKTHNNKNSFELMRPLYEEVRDQWRWWVSTLVERIKKIDSNIPSDLDPKKCVFRIYRDARYTWGVDPYKYNLGCAISPEGKKSTLPLYYIHIEPGNSFFGGGIYWIEADQLNKLRRYLSVHGATYRSLVFSKKFVNRFGTIQWSMSKKVPAGHTKEDPFIDLIMKKQHLLYKHYTDEQVLSEDFMKNVLQDIETCMPRFHLLQEAY